MPICDRELKLAEARRLHPQAFADPKAPSGLTAKTIVRVETQTGALEVLVGEPPSQVTWIYFPGEGWDGY